MAKVNEITKASQGVAQYINNLETESFKVQAGLLLGVTSNGSSYENEEPDMSKAKLVVLLMPKEPTYDDGLLTHTHPAHKLPDGIVRIEGKPSAVLLALKELTKSE